MFQASVCRLPSTGSSISAIFLATILLAVGFVAFRSARRSANRLSLFAVPLLFMGGLAATPNQNDCTEKNQTVAVPATATTPPSTSTPSATSSTSTTAPATAGTTPPGTTLPAESTTTAPEETTTTAVEPTTTTTIPGITGTGLTWSNNVTSTPDGGRVVVGVIENTASFGSVALTSAGQADILVAKQSSTGEWLWAVRAGGSSNDYGTNVRAFSDNSIVVVGRFTGTGQFGSTQLQSGGASDIFVAKLTAGGTWLWALSAGGARDDFTNAVDVLTNGSIVITGFFNDQADFGPVSLTGVGREIYVASIIADGSGWAWATSAGGAGLDAGQGIQASANGTTIVVTGYFTDSASFGTHTLTDPGRQQIFVARVKNDGTGWEWATQASGGAGNYGFGVQVLSTGSVLVSGEFTGTTNFASSSLTSSGETDAFVAKMSASGTWVWALKAGGALWDSATSIAATSDGSSILVAGYYSGTATFGLTNLTSLNSSDDVFVARVKEDGSEWEWAASGGGSDYDAAGGITLTVGGTAVLSGAYTSLAIFGTVTFTSPAPMSLFTVSVTSTGQFQN